MRKLYEGFTISKKISCHGNYMRKYGMWTHYLLQNEARNSRLVVKCFSLYWLDLKLNIFELSKVQIF